MDKTLVWRRAAFLIAAASSISCYGEKGAIEPTIPAAEGIDPVMTLSPSAVIMAVGDTRQLAVDVRTMSGQPVTEFDTVRFWLPNPADSARIKLSPTGLVTAVSPGTLLPVWVYAKVGGRGYASAHAYFHVVQDPIAGVTLSIQPTDSTRIAAGSYKTMNPTVSNTSTGQSVPSPLVRYSVKSEDGNRMHVHRPVMFVDNLRFQLNPPNSPAANQVFAIAPESQVWVYGTVDAFGTVLRDSVLLTITHPFTMTVPIAKTVGSITSQFENRTITFAPGARITFRNSVSPSSDPLRIEFTFDNPDGATANTPASTTGGSAGNVTALNAGQQSVRRFMSAGTYNWTATASNGPAPWPGQTISGTIVIK